MGPWPDVFSVSLRIFASLRETILSHVLRVRLGDPMESVFEGDQQADSQDFARSRTTTKSAEPASDSNDLGRSVEPASDATMVNLSPSSL
jgi:hypothetical protein